MQVPTAGEVTTRVAEIFANASLLNARGKPDTPSLVAELARRLLDNGVLPGDQVDTGAIPIGRMLDDVFPDLVRPGDKKFDLLEERAYKLVSGKVDRALEIKKDGTGPVQALIDAENHKNGNGKLRPYGGGEDAAPQTQEGVTLLRRKVKTPGTSWAWAYYVSDDPDAIEEDALDGLLDRQRIAQENAAKATNYYGTVQPVNASRFASKTRKALDEGTKQAQGLLNA